jgi:hypothetical protein
VRRLVVRALILLGPFVFLCTAFLLLDPFHLVWAVDDPLVQGALMNDRVFQARWLDRHRGEYDAFIVGSSRSKAFQTADWTPYLDGPVRPFHLGVNDETVYGLARRLQFLERARFDIRHVFVSVDARLLGRPRNPEPHIFREHPLVSGEPTPVFYKRFFLAFLDPGFLRAYSHWRLHGEALADTEMYLWTEAFEYRPVTGDHVYASFERELAAGEDAYYARRAKTFARVPARPGGPILSQEGRRLLEEAAGVLNRARSDVRVVVTPNYDQLPLDPADRQALEEAFGPERVWDFSGANAITADMRNYYEQRHFRPHVARDILARVYAAGKAER